jgi:hypothetical protein
MDSGEPASSSPRPPAWLIQRMNAAGGTYTPRYESSLYGAINGFLSFYFPADGMFLVKPQPRLRHKYISAPQENLARPSLDSYHGEVFPREYGGYEQFQKSPDFIVAKGSPGLDNDRLLLIIEVKPQRTLEVSAREQLLGYMYRALSKHRHDTGEPLVYRKIVGLLIIGNMVTVMTLSFDGEETISGPFGFNHGTVHTVLRDAATRNQ